MGRRKRQVVKLFRRKLPTKVFLCPKCGRESMTYNEECVIFKCGVCGLTGTFQAQRGWEIIDYYNALLDTFYNPKVQKAGFEFEQGELSKV